MGLIGNFINVLRFLNTPNMTPEQLAKYGVKSDDEFVAAVDKWREDAAKIAEYEPKVAEYETRLTAATNDLTNVKTEFESYKQAIQPVANDFVRFVDDLAKKGMDNDQIVEALPYTKIKPENLNDIEAIKLEYKLKNKGTNDIHANAYVQSEFSVPEDADDNTKALKEASLISKGNQAKDYVKDFIGKQFTPKADTQRAEQEKQIKDLTSFWSAKIPDIVKNASKVADEFAYTLPGGKGPVQKNIKYEVSIPEQRLAEYQNQFVQSAVRGGIAGNEDGIKQMNDFVRQRINADNDKLIKEAERVATNNAIVDFLFEEFNVKMPDKQPGAGGGGTKKAPTDTEYAQGVFNHMGKKKNT